MSTFCEKDPIPGGACDGYKYQDIGYVMRGGREMDNHFEVHVGPVPLHPLHRGRRATPCWTSTTGSTRTTPTTRLCRATVNRGQDAHTDGKFGLSDKGAMEIMQLFITPDEELYDKQDHRFLRR